MNRLTLLISLLLLLTTCRSIGETDVTEEATAARSVERFALLDGHRIHYLDAGGTSDEAIVLIHGWASSTEAWHHQFPALAARSRVLNVDLIGHGRSEQPLGGFSLALMADSVLAAMDNAGVERAVLIGHSNGVPVAQTFLQRHPDRSLALVGIDGTLKQLLDREMFEGVFAPFLGDGWRDAMTGMIDGMPGPRLLPEDRAAIKVMALATPHRTVVGSVEATLDPDAWREDPITVPLLLILAEQPTWDASYAEWVRRRAPQVDYRVWEDVGHYVQMERPIELHEAILEFLDDNDLLR